MASVADGPLNGVVALVTGASSGLGRHFARTLAGAGASVALGARRTDRLEALAAEIAAEGGTALPLALDVTDAASVEAAVARAVATLGPIGVLVNNSGVATTAPAIDLAESDWDKILDTNLKGAWLMSRAVARGMIAAGTGGSIINIASVTAERTANQLSAYATSKAGLAHLTKGMALELARHQIRVNAIAPGYIETEINAGFFATPAGEAMLKRIPQRRLGKPEDLDGVLLLLATEASRYMTGSVIPVDGGHLVSSL